MNFNKTLSIITLLIVVQGVLRVIIPSYSIVTFVSLVLTTVCLILVYMSRKKILDSVIQKKKIILYFLYYGFFVLMYSCVIAKSYEQWRYVFTVFFPSLMLPVFIFIGGNMESSVIVFKMLIYRALPVSLLLYFSTVTGANDFTHYISFMYVLLLMFPYLTKVWKIILVVISSLSILYDIDMRGNILNFVMVSLILLCYYILPRLFLKKVFRFLRQSMFVLPILFTISGVLGIFNVFEFGDSFRDFFSFEYSNQKTSLVQDTRSDVYGDAFKALIKSDAYLFGISAAGTHETKLANIDEYYETLKNGRMGSEVGILEYLLRGGVLYVFLVLIVYYYSSKLALSQSNNTLCKFLGLFIAFRWLYLFIEAQPTLVPYNISTFLVIGLCLNPAFRKLKDNEVKSYINQIFKL